MTTEERLAKVERELECVKRRSRWLLAALGLGLGAWVLAGTLEPKTAGAQGGTAQVPAVVEAREFRLVDAAGKTRAFLALSADGPALVLVDTAGTTRAFLDLTANGPRLVLADAAGKPRLGLNIVEGAPLLSLSDENGKARAALSVTADGPGLGLRDENGKARVLLSVGKNGPGLSLCDAAENTRAALGVIADGPILGLGDAAGMERALLVVNENGPGLRLLDENGKHRAGLVALKDGPGLALADAAGKTRAALAVNADGPFLALLDAAGEIRAELNTDKNAPALEGNAPLGDRPPERGLDTEGYVFTELGTVRISPRFELEQDLAMGQWSYKAYRVLDKNTGQVSQALQLQVELQSGGVSLPPLFVEVQARSSGNRLVGSGTLFAERVGIMEKLPYRGILLVDSFGEIDVITIRRRGL